MQSLALELPHAAGVGEKKKELYKEITCTPLPLSPSSNILQNCGNKYHALDIDILTQSRYRTFPSPRGALTLPFYSPTHFPPAPTPSYTPGNYLAVLMFSNFTISRMMIGTVS